jgi:hypothetical protein
MASADEASGASNQCKCAAHTNQLPFVQVMLGRVGGNKAAGGCLPHLEGS